MGKNNGCGGRKCKQNFGDTFGGKKIIKETTWCWNEEVQHAIHRKKKARDLNRNERTTAQYEEVNKFAKQTVAKAKRTAKELYKDLEEKDGTVKAIRMVRQWDKNSSDNCQV